MSDADGLAPHEVVLSRLEAVAERRLGQGEQIEFVSLPSSIELAPVRPDLAPVGIFVTPDSLDILIGSIAHESYLIEPGSIERLLAEATELLTAAFNGRLTEHCFLIGDRLVYGEAEIEGDRGRHRYYQGSHILRHLARREDRLFQPYPEAAESAPPK